MHPFLDNSNSCSDIAVPRSEEIDSCTATIMQTGVFLEVERTKERRESGEDKREFEKLLKRDWPEFDRRRKR